MKRLFLVKNTTLVLLFSLLLLSCVSQSYQESMVDDYYNLARSYHELGQYERGEYYYLKSLKANGDSWDTRFNLSLLYLENNQSSKAEPLLLDMYRRDKTNLNILNSLGVVHSMREEWDEALIWYSRSLEEFPWDRTALYNSSLVYLSLEQKIEARGALEKLWERDKSYKTGLALFDLYDDEEGEEKVALLEEIETDEEDEQRDINKKLLDLYLESGSLEKSLSLIETLREDDTEREGWYLFKQGEILMDLYRIEEGLASIREAFRKGFHESNEIDLLEEKLAPSTLDVLKHLEQLYYPDNPS